MATVEKYIFIVFRKKTEQYSHLTCLGGTYQQVQISIQKNILEKILLNKLGGAFGAPLWFFFLALPLMNSNFKDFLLKQYLFKIYRVVSRAEKKSDL